MEWQKLGVKLELDGELGFPIHEFIGEFHRFIQTDRLPIMLIDVHDYSHVHQGPGILLVGDEANLSIDQTDGRVGLHVAYKRPLGGTTGQKLARVLRLAAQAARALERSRHLKPAPAFRSDRFTVVVNDRLSAPNTEETRATFEPELRAFVAEAYAGVECALEPESDPRRLFGMRVALSQRPTFDELIKSLATLQ
ncbi:MAG: hypothetical protein KC609_13205 [Myxococcales bacterium]|nr:hypothetical protein [Myxococcales bacterium]